MSRVESVTLWCLEEEPSVFDGSFAEPAARSLETAITTGQRWVKLLHTAGYSWISMESVSAVVVVEEESEQFSELKEELQK